MEEKKEYVIRCRDWWFADWSEGDSPRTLLIANAKHFTSEEKAQRYLTKMAKRNPHRDFADAVIELFEGEKP